MTDDVTLPSSAGTVLSESNDLRTTAGETGDGLYVVLARRNHAADWCSDCLKRIDRLRDLDENWNSYGAKPVDPRSVEVAKQFLQELAVVSGIKCPRVAASPDGNVALSWEWREHLRELDLEILPDCTLRYSYIDQQQPSRDAEDETNDPNLIAQLLTQW